MDRICVRLVLVFFFLFCSDWDTDHFYPARQVAIDGRLAEVAGKKPYSPLHVSKNVFYFDVKFNDLN